VKEAPQRPHRLRRLSDEEIALWAEVARGVKRRRGAALPAPSKPAAGEPSPPPAASPKAAPSRQSRAPERPAPSLAPIDRRLRRELARGRAPIDAALDLHGLTQAEAHEALRGFLRHSQAEGARLVIVVTGKGGPLDDPRGWPQERGVLRRLAPHWLREPDLRSVVLGFEEAGRAHGGSGALYVRLRRLKAAAARERRI
jgi:DNA-nicking Smr family endonuclease